MVKKYDIMYLRYVVKKMGRCCYEWKMGITSGGCDFIYILER